MRIPDADMRGLVTEALQRLEMVTTAQRDIGQWRDDDG
jgi:hypothetical protein